jgi:K+ transporter
MHMSQCTIQLVLVTAAAAAAVAAAEVNYMLLVLCIAVVAGFQSGTAIGNAYGAQPPLH